MDKLNRLKGINSFVIMEDAMEPFAFAKNFDFAANGAIPEVAAMPEAEAMPMEKSARSAPPPSKPKPPKSNSDAKNKEDFTEGEFHVNIPTGPMREYIHSYQSSADVR